MDTNQFFYIACSVTGTVGFVSGYFTAKVVDKWEHHRHIRHGRKT